MSTSTNSKVTQHTREGAFGATRWTIVCAAADATSSSRADRALEELCQMYWYPLYAYVRRQGHDAQAAEDLTQEFFARFLSKNYLQSVERSKGKFRSFLLACLQHFLADEWDRSRAQKRGGGQQPIPLDAGDAESRFQREPCDNVTPDKLYDRQWALTLLDRVLARLREQYVADGKAETFDFLKDFLAVGQGAISYAEAARKLGKSEGAAKVAVHRMRKRYRELLHGEIAHTVCDPAQVEEEIRALFAAFGP